LSYPHPDWKAWDFYDPETLLSPARFIEVSAWHTRPDTLLGLGRVSDECYVLNMDLGATYYSGSGLRSLALRPLKGFNQYDRVGNRILWKRVVLRLILEATNDMSIIEKRPEILRISLVYSRIASGAGHLMATEKECPVRWADVYNWVGDAAGVGASVGSGVHSEMNLANKYNIIILKEWMFCEGTTEAHVDPLQILLDVNDRTLKKTFVTEMDLPDLPHDWVENDTVSTWSKYGYGDLCLLVNSTEPLVEGLSRSRYRIKFSGRLYFVDSE